MSPATLFEMLARPNRSVGLTLDKDGAEFFAKALDKAECLRLESFFAAMPASLPGVRIGDVSQLKPFLDTAGSIGKIAAAVLGPEARPVRAILFDKTAERNWALGWHQDRTIAVKERANADGFGPWTVKSGLIHVEPPFDILERMVTVRVHLDAADNNNAPLRIVPGSHKLGRLPEAELGWAVVALAQPRMERPGVLESAAAALAAAGGADAAVAAFVHEVWPVLAEGQTSKPYSESRNLPTMLAALVRPNEAYGINTDPVQQTAQALLGRKLLGWNAMTPDEYASVLALVGEIRRTMRDDWGWAPRDLWDVQGFVWEVNRVDQPELPGDGQQIEAGRPKEKPMPTNLILYGPPGTGKTFATAREAVGLCDGEAPADEAGVRARYAELVAAGQVRFVTFHQSYSYEDFVEGLRPTTGEAGAEGASGGFRLEPVPGVFREIASIAEQAMRTSGSGGPFDMTGRKVFKMSLGRAGSEDHIFDAAIEGDYVVLGWGGDVDWTPYDTYDLIHAKWNELHPGNNGNDANIVQTSRFRADMREGDLVVVSYGNTRFRAIGEVVGPYEFGPTEMRDYNHRRAVRWLFVPDEPLPITFYDKPFTMRSCYLLRDNQLNREALSLLLPGTGGGRSVAPAQFVLICDEINRANISKVFGELITLIEPDKRIGGDYELRLTLPYSKHSFSVPSNLHIVGTMNTADRSIALLDTALRRRFMFSSGVPAPEPASASAAKSRLIITTDYRGSERLQGER